MSAGCQVMKALLKTRGEAISSISKMNESKEQAWDQHQAAEELMMSSPDYSLPNPSDLKTYLFIKVLPEMCMVSQSEIKNSLVNFEEANSIPENLPYKN